MFCWNCGAPQVTLSEELREQAEATKALGDASAPVTQSYDSSQPPDLLVVWKAAILIAALVALALSVASVLLPPLELMAWAAPAIVLSIYCTRYKQTRITAGVGARLGLVCGIFTGFGLVSATAAQMLVLRFGLHRGSEFETSMDGIIAQAKAQALAQSGPAAAAMFNQLNIPEFRAGFFLAGLAMVTLVLLLLSTAGGAFAGFMRGKARLARER